MIDVLINQSCNVTFAQISFLRRIRCEVLFWLVYYFSLSACGASLVILAITGITLCLSLPGCLLFKSVIDGSIYIRGAVSETLVPRQTTRIGGYASLKG